MKKIYKRVTSLLLAICMMATMLSAYAAGGDEIASYSEVITYTAAAQITFTTLNPVW